MKRYPISQPAITPQSTLQSPASLSSSPGQSPAAFDVQALLDKANIILSREIQNMLIASSGGKLDSAASKDLVQYVKLLSELKAEQAKALSNLTPEELEALSIQNTSDQP